MSEGSQVKLSTKTEKRLDTAVSALFGIGIGLLYYHEWYSTVVGLAFYFSFCFAAKYRQQCDAKEKRT